MLMFRKREIWTGFLIAILVAFLAPALPLPAQVTGATLAGTITDSAGNVVLNAKIVIRNLAQGTTRIVSSNQTGDYLARTLYPARMR